MPGQLIGNPGDFAAPATAFMEPKASQPALPLIV